MYRLFCYCALAAFAGLGLAGCGSDSPTNTMEGVSEQQVQDYDAMIEAENAMMEEEGMGEADE